ncbi:hypothetical protein INS49_003400 [Diaporthe citri]|uniref:uncharacterized protein n=1 Tax=Diaporthe citri TaxID=83186 RepID=UPI001C824671|nr:uncharacterized protein INS49_003400 [Diaporthe citri]KAG6355438.1 hypothetical protein INS49_003400 [Diaporthe citri]
MTKSDPYPTQYIHFPRSWNEKWSSEGVTNLEKAKIMLHDFISNDESDENEKLELWEFLSASHADGNLETVTSLATAVQHLIRKVEDALLKRAQDSIFDGIIHLHGAEITNDATLIEEAGDDFHLILGTDGANSWVRRHYFSEEQEPCGRSFALGVALDRGDRGLPRSQALNVLLTLCQTMFLLNSSHQDSTGYLNMLLTEHEYDQCISLDGIPADFGSLACIRTGGIVPPGFTNGQIFAPYDEGSRLWESISDGLRLFGFEESDVKSIVRIPINLMGVSTATKVLTLESRTRRRPHCLVSLAGDSALTHHFWPGRGMNSGIKAAIAWSNQVSDLILERKEGLVGLEPHSLNPYLDFMKWLRDREHTQRSFVVQKASASPERMEENMSKAHTLLYDPDRMTTTKVGEKVSEFARQGRLTTTKLSDRVTQLAKRLAGPNSRRWPHPPTKDLAGTVLQILSQLMRRTKAEMYHSGPWPIEKMNGPEVYPPKLRIPNLPRSRPGRDTSGLRVPQLLLAFILMFIAVLLEWWLESWLFMAPIRQ